LAATAVLCASAVAQTPPESAAEQAQAWQALQRTVHSAACKQDSDCHVVGVGVRSCGGPQQYVPWSSRVTSGKRLKVVVARYNHLRQAQIEPDGENSTCALLPVPDVYCAWAEAAKAKTGQCSLRPTTQGER
jgi:hypothetical protein